jgi:hypothetical protein
VTSCQNPDFTALDAHIRTQLVGAAETYAAHTNLLARLKAIPGVREQNNDDSEAAADS